MLGAGLALAAGACATVPNVGPTAGQIRDDERRHNATGFRLDEVTPETAAALGAPPPAGASLAALAADGRVDLIGPGDALAIDVFEVGVALFARGGGTGAAGGTGFSASAGATRLDAVVDADGRIALPYVGRVVASGRTPAELARVIEQGLAGLSQRPQVTVAVRANAHNVFFVSGDVKAPGRFDLGLPRQRLLDAVARAGGPTAAPADAVVRLTRGLRSAEARLGDVAAGGAQDLALLPGDRVELVNRPRTFLLFGASDRVSQQPFGAETVSLAEALARTGGPSERVADPAAVFLFRWAPGTTGTAPVPQVWRLNLKRADGYFLSQRVMLRDKDVVYVAPARVNAAAKVTQIVGQLFTPFAIARSVTR
jgi:polysaccharide export outer membrane protein